MDSIEKIVTIENIFEYKFKEKASQFIGRAYPAQSEEEAQNILTEVKKEFYDARHHCYAWKLGDDSVRYSDDGEPGGTAGIRILNAIEHFELVNIIVISIRYFGGVKLGVGPLGKAYYNSAFGVLEAAEKIEKVKYKKLRIKYEYEFTSKIHHFLGQYQTIIKDTLYEDLPVIEFLLRTDMVEGFRNELFDASNGKLEVTDCKETVLVTL